jgi:hypothetical protein
MACSQLQCGFDLFESLLLCRSNLFMARATRCVLMNVNHAGAFSARPSAASDQMIFLSNSGKRRVSDRRTRRLRDAVELAARQSDEEQKPNLSASQSEKNLEPMAIHKIALPPVGCPVTVSLRRYKTSRRRINS